MALSLPKASHLKKYSITEKQNNLIKWEKLSESI